MKKVAYTNIAKLSLSFYKMLTCFKGEEPTSSRIASAFNNSCFPNIFVGVDPAAEGYCRSNDKIAITITLNYSEKLNSNFTKLSIIRYNLFDLNIKSLSNSFRIL